MPDAPTPHYDRQGNLDLEWLMVVRYDPARQCVTVSWTKDGDLFRSSKRGAVAHPITDMQEITDAMIATTAMLANPALF